MRKFPESQLAPAPQRGALSVGSQVAVAPGGGGGGGGRVLETVTVAPALSAPWNRASKARAVSEWVPFAAALVS